MMDTFPRGAQSFLEMDGTYNWTKPSGQLFFLKRARELGVEKIVAFSNSPHRRQTKNGLARASKAGFVPDGFYRMRNQFSRYWLDGGNGEGGKYGNQVITWHQYTDDDGWVAAKQTWIFYHVEEGRYRIGNLFWSDQCLYAADRKSGSILSLQPCSDTQNTTWTVTPAQDGRVTIKLTGSELYLSVLVSTRGEARDETRWRCGSGGWPADGRTDG